ncbi:hypothetical protein BGZ63DRAFT_365182 [Mariannaea sp. PMI_226]|nr:hypothetical protein BGZ63DRAFT_365182 [Mariannaea sp. PMI_226]
MASLLTSFLSWLRGDTQTTIDLSNQVPFLKRQANLEFLDDSHPKYKTEKPYYSNVPFTKKDAPNTNVISRTQRLTLCDIRGHEDLFDLDIQGFELVKRQWDFDQWQDGQKVVQEVYPQVSELLKKRLGEDVRVVVFDHTVCGGVETSKEQSDDNFAPPSRVAHIDQTYKATVEQIKLDFKKEADTILQGRFRIVNIWHPIQGPVKQHPFVLCDYRSCKTDYSPCDLVYPHTVTEIMVFKNSPSQNWYFIDQQTEDEAWVFKIVDSQSLIDPDVAEFSAHTSFFDENEALAGCKRESVEFRAYIFG